MSFDETLRALDTERIVFLVIAISIYSVYLILAIMFLFSKKRLRGA